MINDMQQQCRPSYTLSYNATSFVKSQLRTQTVSCHFDVGRHGRAHGGRVPRVPRGGYAPDRDKVSQVDVYLSLL